MFVGSAKSQFQLGNKDVLDLFVGGHGTIAGDDVVAGVKGMISDAGEQRPGGRPILVYNDIQLFADGTHSTLKKYGPFGGDCRQKTDFFTAFFIFVGHFSFCDSGCQPLNFG